MDTFSWVTLGIGFGSLGLVAARERRGSAAVDIEKRRADLSRFLDPKYNATANERAMAEKQLAKLPRAAARTSAPRASAASPRTVPPWQTDPRGNSDIYRNDLSDLNFAKKAIYEHTLRSRPRRGFVGRGFVEVMLWGFDGACNRGGFSAFSSLYAKDLGYAGQVMETWWTKGPLSSGRPHEAVVVSHALDHRNQVVRIRGQDVASLELWVEDDSFNSNPFNDPGFARALNAVIQAHGDSHG